MTVAFILPSAFNEASGVWQKVLLQAQTLRDLGERALIFSFSGKTGATPVDHIHFPLEPRTGKEKQIARLISRVLESGVDVAYLRRELWHPSYRKLMRSIPTVAEINTLESEEFKLTMSLPRRIYACLTRAAWRRYPAGFVSMTRELATNLPSGKPLAIIPNGITRQPSRENHSARPELFFSGTGGYAWHGLDKYISMAALFPQWSFHLAGELPPSLASSNLPANLKSYGALPVAEADALLARANIGVGTLALHRKKMEEACPLKVRSYLSGGLPSIIAYHDTDFSSGFPFICQLPNTEDNITPQREKIRTFVEANYSKPVPWESVRFASETEKAAARRDFFASVVKAQPCRA